VAYNVSKVTVLGKLAFDGEKKTVGDKPMVSCRMAANVKRGTKEFTTWYNFAVWDKLAEAIAPRLTKGQLVFVSGDLEAREYKKKDGSPGTSLDIHVETIVICDPKPASDPGAPSWG